MVFRFRVSSVCFDIREVNGLALVCNIGMRSNFFANIVQIFISNNRFALQRSGIKGKGNIYRSFCGICRKGGRSGYLFTIHQEVFTGLLVHKITGNRVFLTCNKVLVMNLIGQSNIFLSRRNITLGFRIGSFRLDMDRIVDIRPSGGIPFYIVGYGISPVILRNVNLIWRFIWQVTVWSCCFNYEVQSNTQSLHEINAFSSFRHSAHGFIDTFIVLAVTVGIGINSKLCAGKIFSGFRVNLGQHDITAHRLVNKYPTLVSCITDDGNITMRFNICRVDISVNTVISRSFRLPNKVKTGVNITGFIRSGRNLTQSTNSLVGTFIVLAVTVGISIVSKFCAGYRSVPFGIRLYDTDFTLVV